MGDDTPAEAQPETKSQPQDSSQPPDEPPQSKAPDPVTEPPNDLTHKPPSTCKIPVRPNKLRKLSVKPSTGETRKTELPEEMLGDLSDGDHSKTLTVAKVSVTVTAKNKRKNSSIPARVLPIVIKPLSAEGEIDAALRHLRVADPLLVELIDSLPPPAFDSNQSPFLALTKSILYQQLAYKAGTSIYTRFVELCGGEDGVLPDAVLSLSCPQLRQIGVSARKATYLYDLANKFKTGILSDSKIVGMDDKSLFTMLSMVKGIGSWSVHMFMIFSLHRPDVLPVSDVGVRKGVQILNGLEELPRPSQMDKHCEKWKPYRSVGSWYMWRLVEGKGNQQAGAPMTLEGIMPLQQQQEETQQQHQLQLLEPINGSANFGVAATVTAKNRMINSSISARVLPIVINPLSAEGKVSSIKNLLMEPKLQSKPVSWSSAAAKMESCRTPCSTSCSQLQQIGISARKASFLYDLANKYKTGILSYSKIVGMDDKSLFTMLSMVEGMGSWSVHMFMIFSFHRPDVLLVDDVEVRTGVQILNGLEELPTPSQMYKYCDKWKPFRSGLVVYVEIS